MLYEEESYGLYGSCSGSWAGCSFYQCCYSDSNPSLTYGLMVASDSTPMEKSYASFPKYYYRLRVTAYVLKRELPVLGPSSSIKIYYKGIYQAEFSLASGSGFTCFTGTNPDFTTTVVSGSCVIDPTSVSNR